LTIGFFARSLGLTENWPETLSAALLLTQKLDFGKLARENPLPFFRGTSSSPGFFTSDTMLRGAEKDTSDLDKALFATEQYTQFPGLAQAETIYKLHI
jgi:hypothetical protein